jgi:hypothetical protein
MECHFFIKKNYTKYKIITIIITVRRLAKPTQATALLTPQTTSFDDVSRAATIQGLGNDRAENEMWLTSGAKRRACD